MNNRLKAIGMIAVVFAFVFAACLAPSAQENDRMLGFPTKIPEVIKEVAVEAEEIAEEASVAMPPDPLDIESEVASIAMPPDPLDIEMVPLMYYQEAEDYLAPYHGMIEGMIFTKAIDLEVVDIVDDSANAQRGFMFEALITVRNNGFATSPQVKLDCDVAGGNDIGGWAWVAPLAPGESRDIRTGFTSSSLAGGTYNYTCTIDADNTLIEFNKLNNSRTESITVTMTNTDLAIMTVEDISKAAVIGYDHEFKVTIENVGPERSYKVLMRCSYQKNIATVEEQVVWVGQMNNAGDTVQVICGFNGVPTGTRLLTVEVDWGNMIDETNEKNNTAELSFNSR